MKVFHMALFLALIPIYLAGQVESAYQNVSFQSPDGAIIEYRILYPESYGEEEGEQYPLVLFLHGSGERGADNTKQLTHGAQLFLDSIEQYPAIVVFPQCPDGLRWSSYESTGTGFSRQMEFPFEESPSEPMAQVQKLLQILSLTEQVDTNRLYLMGLSMGAMGTFDLLARQPHTFAAAVPICGGGNLEIAERYAGHTRLWIFHGARDNVVPVENSRRMYEALKEAGADVRYTEFPEANHNSWDPTFAEPELLKWLFAQ